MATGKGGFDRNVTVAAPEPEVPGAGDVAAVLLWLGTLAFPLAALGLALTPAELMLPSYRGAALGCLVSYGAMILAYIGGIQQAAAVHADGARAGAWPLVVAGIGVALLGWALVVRSQLRAAGVDAGGLLAEPQVEPLLLAVIYGWQAWLEACAGQWATGLPAGSRLLMQSEGRRLPMAVAALSLLVASRYTRAGHAELAAVDPAAEGAARLEWVDDSYALAATAATVLALLGSFLARPPTAAGAAKGGGKEKNA